MVTMEGLDHRTSATAATEEARPEGTGVEMGREISPQGPIIHVKVAYGTRQHAIAVSCRSSFGDLKFTLAPLTGLQPQEQRLLFKGKQVADGDQLHTFGVREKSKLLLVEDPASKERKWEEAKRMERIARACQAVDQVRGDVNKLVGQVTSLEAIVLSGKNVSENEFTLLTELLTRQLLKLDSIEAEGEAKLQRKSEVQRIQNYADMLDRLKVQNEDHSSGRTVVTSEWETFDNGAGSISGLLPSTSSTKLTTEWERFD